MKAKFVKYIDWIAAILTIGLLTVVASIVV